MEVVKGVGYGCIDTVTTNGRVLSQVEWTDESLTSLAVERAHQLTLAARTVTAVMGK